MNVASPHHVVCSQEVAVMNRAGANAVNLHRAASRNAVSRSAARWSGEMNVAHQNRAANRSAVSRSAA